MTRKAILPMVATAILAIALASCGTKDETSNTPAGGSVGTPAGRPVDLATAGSIRGSVELDGNPPALRSVNMTAVANCAKQHSSPAMTEDVVPGDGGTLQNVVVYLKGDFAEKFQECKSKILGSK